MRLRLHVVLALAAGALLLLQLQRRVLSGSSPPALQQPGLPPAPRRHAPQRAFAPSVHTAPPTDALEQEAPSEPSEPRASAASLSVPPPVAEPVAAAAELASARRPPSQAAAPVALVWCRKAAAAHDVVPYRSWGSLTLDGRANWTALTCDALLSGAPRRSRAAARACRGPRGRRGGPGGSRSR